MPARIHCLGVLMVALLGAGSCAADPATGPSTLAISPTASVDDVLDALHARGTDLKDISADVKLSEMDNNSGDVTIHTGTFALQKKADDDARAKIVFTSKQRGTHIEPQDHRYVLDNGQLIERDYKNKTQIIRHIAKPGQKLNLLKLGEGPFPLPIGQSRQDVLAQFDVKKIDPAKDDPPGTIHLQLLPKPGSSFAHSFKTIDVWVELATAMPIRIATLDRNETTVKTTDLNNVKINSGLQDKDFAEPELPAGWELHDEPYSGQ